MENNIVLPTCVAKNIAASQWAHLEYKGEPKMVKRARAVSPELEEKIVANGCKVALAGSACKYSKIYKCSSSKILFGKGIKYVRMVKKTAVRAADMVVDYTPSHREMGYFPIFEELFFVKNDFSRMYMRAYGIAGDTSKPDVHYYAVVNGEEIEIPVWEIVQWLPSADFDKYNGTEKPSGLRDDDGNFVVKQDEDGNPMFDADGNPILVPFPMIKLYKLFDPMVPDNRRPLKVIINGKNIINDVLNWDNPLTAGSLENIKAAYEARIAESEQ